MIESLHSWYHAPCTSCVCVCECVWGVLQLAVCDLLAYKYMSIIFKKSLFIEKCGALGAESLLVSAYTASSKLGCAWVCMCAGA
jgi:hypothetical protein